MKHHRVSIIIPHRDQPYRLKMCLDRLIDLGYQTHELIIVDNGSSESLQFLENYPVKILDAGPVPSPYRARNYGIMKASGEIIVLLDVNCLVYPGWLERAEDVLTERMIVSGLPARPATADHDAWQRFDFLYSLPDAHSLLAPQALPATNLFFFRRVWEEMGPFREVRSLGDMEWTIRARNSGIALRYEDSIRFEYPFKSRNVFTTKFRRLGKGMMENDFVRYPLLYILKNLLPPSPAFVRRMHRLNRQESMNLSCGQIIFICYVVKINKARGVIRYYL